MNKLVKQKQIRLNPIENDISFFKDVQVSGSVIVSQSLSFGSSESDNHVVTGSLLIQGDIISSGNVSIQELDIYDRLLFRASNNFIFTSQSNDTELTIGNQYNNYEYKQTTTFKNAEVVVSGSLTLTEGVLIFQPKDTEPDVVDGGMYYSSNGSFFLGS